MLNLAPKYLENYIPNQKKRKKLSLAYIFKCTKLSTKMRSALLSAVWTTPKGLIGSSVNMSNALRLPPCWPLRFFLCTPTLQGERNKLPLEGRLKLKSHSSDHNNGAVIYNNAQKILPQLDALLEKPSYQPKVFI